MATEFDDFESDLDQYIEDEEPGWLHEFVAEQVRRAPWWTISLLIHVIALLIMYKWPYRADAIQSAVAPIEVDLYETDDEDITEEPPPPEEQEVEEDLEVEIKDIPISPEPPTKEDPGPDLDMPLVNEMVKDVERPVPSIDPPSNTPVFAVNGPVKGLRRGIYSGRSRAGQGRAIGGAGGTSKNAQSAVMAGLIWLAKAQEGDGRWSCKRWEGGGDYDVGMTGLALLAFLGAGYTHTKGKFKNTVSKGLNWLRANQKGNGSFGWKTFYEQGIATMAVSEAYGLTRSPSIGRMAQAAINYVIAEQPEHGGYRYRGGTTKNDGDTSVTGWQIMAIKSAICSELKVPESAVERSRVFLKNVKRDYGQSSYIVSSAGGAPAVSAIGMLCKQFLGGDYDAEIGECADYLLRNQKVALNAKNALVGDLYYTYYSVLAMFQMGGEYWNRWNKAFRDPLVKCQVHTPVQNGKFVRGSWDPKNHNWASRGGRVYSTAMAILSLEVYYRFLPVYKR
jgi:hypothetical protein